MADRSKQENSRPEPRISFSRKVPEGDAIERQVCDHCGFVDYVNPRIIVGSVVRHEEKILMCRRAIEPRRGYWTLPAGFLELGESVEEAARREALEEAEAEIELQALLAVYSVTHISQVQIMYLARLVDGHFAPGPESLETALFAPEELPLEDLAFPSVAWALAQAAQVAGERAFAPFSNPPKGEIPFLPGLKG